jgi:hypothetical protein
MGLEHVQLMMELEEEFGITIPDEHVPLLSTIGDVHAYLVRRLEPGVQPDNVWARLERILLEEHDLKPEWIRPETDLYRDLAFDR